jgi:hypothetical protein
MIKLRSVGWAGHVECMKEVRNAYRVLISKPEMKRLLGESRHIWEDVD